MIKYKVSTDIFDFNPKQYKDIQFGYFETGIIDSNPRTIALVDSLEEARKIINTVPVRTDRFSYTYARAYIAFVEMSEYEYDEDLEDWVFISGSDYYDFRCEPIKDE